MMNTYTENEVKILDIDKNKVESLLVGLGAVKVYDDIRVITSYDTVDRVLTNSGKQLKITEEGSVKMSIDQLNENGKVVSIKNKLGRKVEMEDTLRLLGYVPIARVQARRISFELTGNDFDIDIFPNIPPFLEVDCEDVSQRTSIIESLGLTQHDTVSYSTIKVFEKYGVDYYEVFKV